MRALVHVTVWYMNQQAVIHFGIYSVIPIKEPVYHSSISVMPLPPFSTVPPPLPSAIPTKIATPIPRPPKPPTIGLGRPGAVLVSLALWNGAPFKDHWAYWVDSPLDATTGNIVHADGDVMRGFRFEIKRGVDFGVEGNAPTSRIPLQWVGGRLFDDGVGGKMVFNGVGRVDVVPVCEFERSAGRVQVPGKSLNAVSEQVGPSLSLSCSLSLRYMRIWLATDEIIHR